MVIGLQLPFGSLPLKGMPGTSQPMDSELIQFPSFEEILKLKEKQLQYVQQVSASSIAAALVALQAQSIAPPVIIPSMETGQAQADSSLDESPRVAVNPAGNSPSSFIAQPATVRLVPTETVATVPQALPNIQAEPVLQPTDLLAEQVPAVSTSGLSVTDTKQTDFTAVAAKGIASPRPVPDAANVILTPSAPEAMVDRVAPALKNPVSAVVPQMQNYSAGTATSSFSVMGLRAEPESGLDAKPLDTSAISLSQTEANTARVNKESVAPFEVNRNTSGIPSTTVPQTKAPVSNGIESTPVLNSAEGPATGQGTPVSSVADGKTAAISPEHTLDFAPAEEKQFSSVERIHGESNKLSTEDIPSRPQPEIQREVSMDMATSAPKVDNATVPVSMFQPKATVQNDQGLGTLIPTFTAHTATPEIISAKNNYQASEAIALQVTEKADVKVVSTNLQLPGNEISESVSSPGVVVKDHSHVDLKNIIFAAPAVVRTEAEAIVPEKVADKFTSESNLRVNQPAQKPATGPETKSEPIPANSVKPASGFMQYEVEANVEQDVPNPKFVAETKINQSTGNTTVPKNDAETVEETNTSLKTEVTTTSENDSVIERPVTYRTAQSEISSNDQSIAARKKVIPNRNADGSLHSEGSVFASVREVNVSVEQPTTREVRLEKLSSDIEPQGQSLSQTTVKNAGESPISHTADAEEVFISQESTALFARNTHPIEEEPATGHTVRLETQHGDTTRVALNTAEEATESIAPVIERPAELARQAENSPDNFFRLDGVAMPASQPGNGDRSSAASETGHQLGSMVSTFEPIEAQAKSAQTDVEWNNSTIEVGKEVPASSHVSVAAQQLVSSEISVNTVLPDTAKTETKPDVPQQPGQGPTHMKKAVSEKPVEKHSSSVFQETRTFQSDFEIPAAQLDLQTRDRHERKDVETQERVEVSQLVDPTAIRTGPGETFVESNEAKDQDIPVTVDQAAKTPEQVGLKPKESLITTQTGRDNNSWPVAGHSSTSEKTVNPSDLQDFQATETVARSELHEKPTGIEPLETSAEQAVELQVPRKKDPGNVKAADPTPVAVESTEKLITDQDEILEIPQLLHTAAPGFSKPVIHSDMPDVPPAQAPRANLEPEHHTGSIRLDQTANTPQRIAEVKVQSNQDLSELKVSEHRFVSVAPERKFTADQTGVVESPQPVELSKKAGTGQTEAAEQNQFISDHAGIPSRPLGRMDGQDRQRTETSTRFVGANQQDKPAHSEQPANTKTVVNMSLQNDNRLTNANIASAEAVITKQQEKLNTSQATTAENSQPVEAEKIPSTKTEIQSDVSDIEPTRSYAEIAGLEDQKEPLTFDQLASIAEGGVEAKVPEGVDLVNVNVSKRNSVFVEQQAKSSVGQNKPTDNPHQLSSSDGSISSRSVIRADVPDSQPVVEMVEPERRENPIAANLSTEDMTTDLKLDVREPVFVALKEKSSTDQAPVIRSSQPTVDDVAVAHQAAYPSYITESQSAETVFTPVEMKAEAKPLHAAKSILETPQNTKSVVEPKADAQAEKSTIGHVSVAHEHEPVIQGSPVEQIEPKHLIKAQRPVAQDAEAQPTAEKRPGLNQMPDAVLAANGPGKEAQAVEFNGKLPLGQYHAQAAEVAQQVIRQMKVNLKSGATAMHLQLNPKELGVIEVDMVSSSQGVQVTFFAEQASTGRLLETQLNQLRDALVDSGVQLSGLNIGQHHSQGQKGGTFSQEPNFAPFTQQHFADRKLDDAPTAERSIGQSSEVDYRV